MFKEVYIYNEESNEYIGESITMLDPEETRMQGKDVWMMPPNSTELKPEFREGYAPIWNGESWDYVEDHRGEKGYIGKESTEIKELGPLPEGFSINKPAPTEEEQAEWKKQRTISKINQLEYSSSQSLNTIMKAQLSGQEVSSEDMDNYIKIEATIKRLRSELAAVGE